MSGAGSLRERVTFVELVSGDDGYGGTFEGWEDAFTDAARLAPKMGSEPVIAGRMQGIQPYTLTVRSNVNTRRVRPYWKARNHRTGTTYEIKTIVNIDERNAYLEMLVVEGEAS
ncbi:head-tail adaptor protein [Limoniibacter endophyticus]|uniref:Head-tail adaptor protein n=1 Tax=Limoniibacter endophyticus TaxID=1565040 RepID=A0A8J3GGQ5_9HYPH|nr:head-tail adaptor protein [Limoniibacter endophyticus]GHC61600.1 head-tail adaptor protein [Limoniibacter endophyticus]